MYVARFSRNGMRLNVKLFEKHWSQEMLSHEVIEIKSKNFLLRSSAYRWIHKEVVRQIVARHGLEVID